MAQTREKQESKLCEVATKFLCSKGTLYLAIPVFLFGCQSPQGTNSVLLTMTTGQLGREVLSWILYFLYQSAKSLCALLILKRSRKTARGSEPL